MVVVVCETEMSEELSRGPLLLVFCLPRDRRQAIGAGLTANSQGTPAATPEPTLHEPPEGWSNYRITKHVRRDWYTNMHHSIPMLER